MKPVALEQRRLPLDGAPASSALEAAFHDSGLPLLGYTLKTALAVPHIRLCLTRSAEAAHRAKRHHHPA